MTEFDTFQLVWIFFAVITFIKWLLKYDMGRKALESIEEISNNFSLQDIALAIAIYLLVTSLTAMSLKGEDSLHQKISLSAISNAILIIFFIPILHTRYTKGLKAILPPLNKLGNNIFTAICYSIPAYGIAAFIMTITVVVCSAFGYEKVQQHNLLKLLQESNADRITIVYLYISAAVLTPIMEEIMFRGIIQTTVISITNNKWTGIFISAIIFAVIHIDYQHIPALFFLGSFFGYAFSKHHSLLIAILMHAVFNAINITGVLLNS